MGRFKSLGSLKSFLWYAPQLSGASVLCFPILSPLRVHRWGEAVVPDCLMVGILFPSSVPSGLTIRGGCSGWWPQHPSFTDMAGGILSPQDLEVQVIIKIRNWGPDKAKDSVSHHEGLADPDLLIQNLVVFHWASRAQPLGDLKLFQEIQECICIFGFAQFVYIERASCYCVCSQSLTQTHVFYLGIVENHYSRTWFISIQPSFSDVLYIQDI